MATDSLEDPVAPVEASAPIDEPFQDPASADYQPTRDSRGRVVRLRDSVDAVARSWERAWDRITVWTNGGEAKAVEQSPQLPKTDKQS